YALPQFGYDYIYTGEGTLKRSFVTGTESASHVAGLQSFHKDHMLIVHDGAIGLLSETDPESATGKFTPFQDQKHLSFYEHYMRLRDAYLRQGESNSGTLR